MREVVCLSRLTFLQGVRSRVFYTLLFFAALLVLSTVVLNQMTVGDPTKIIQDVGLATVSFFTLLLILFVGSEVVGKDMETPAVFFILSKPISRARYLLGRFLGLLGLLYANMVAFTGIILLILFLYSHTFKWVLFLSVGLTAIEMAILLSFLCLFFLFISPTLTPFLVLAIFVIGHTTTEVREIFAHKEGIYHYVSIGLYYLFPNFDLLSVQTEVVHNVPIPILHLVYGCLYGIAFVVVVLWIAIWILNRKDF